MDQSLPSAMPDRADGSALDARIYALERAQAIAEFHDREARRETSITFLIMQLGCAAAGLAVLASVFGWVPAETFSVESPLSQALLSGAVALLLLNASLGAKRLLSDRVVSGGSGPIAEPAE
jgi:hypothetical protein